MTTSPSNAMSNLRDTATNPVHDTRRCWLWWFLVVIAASQLYFVRELAAAFVLFAIAFMAIAFVAASLYLLAKASAMAILRLAELRHRLITVTPVPAGQRKVA